MDFFTLAELAAPDRRALYFSSLGMGGPQDPDLSCRWLQSMIATALLAIEVPNDVQRSFERLRTLHAYGVLCYDTFTVVYERACLLLEQALRVRFIAFYEGRVPIADAAGHEATFLADSFDDVFDAFGRGGSHGRMCRVRLRSGAASRQVPTTLTPLFEWARAEKLLDGQRSRMIEKALAHLRNGVAHPESYHLVGPHDSALAICDLAEIINRLWGERTPGGRLYPAPIARTVYVFAWRHTGQGLETAQPRPEQLDTLEDRETWKCIVLRAVPTDVLIWFDTRHEGTVHPSELLWGPGTVEEAANWLDEKRPGDDEVDCIDRLFAVQVDGGRARRPRRPEVAMSLASGDRQGQWYVLRADDPSAALAYVRRETGEVAHSADMSTDLPVEVVVVGTWDNVNRHLEAMGVVREDVPLAFRMPDMWSSAGVSAAVAEETKTDANTEHS